MMKFPGGESHPKLNNRIDYSNVRKVVITHRVKNGDDLMQIMLAQNALKGKGVKRFDLILPYLPYARQDRMCANGEAFSLKVFTDLINMMAFDSVHIVDAHSDVAPALINNCHNHSNTQYVRMVIDSWFSECNKPLSDIVLISPDSGANKKIKMLHDELGFPNIPIVKCDKKRDVTDGSLSGFEVFATDLEGKDCLIVDDICDGGFTFIGIAEELRKKNAGDIYLFVTHGIFSKGFIQLLESFKKVYTTNSFGEIYSGQFPSEVLEKYVTQFKIAI
jgi:ribose-phosphate pyrophosphokinase